MTFLSFLCFLLGLLGVPAVQHIFSNRHRIQMDFMWVLYLLTIVFMLPFGIAHVKPGIVEIIVLICCVPVGLLAYGILYVIIQVLRRNVTVANLLSERDLE